MTPEQATEFREILSLLLGEIVRVKSAIQQGQFACKEEYAELVERTFQTVGDLVLETHALFCGEAP